VLTCFSFAFVQKINAAVAAAQDAKAAARA
jgi:hypothetical protein